MLGIVIAIYSLAAIADCGSSANQAAESEISQWLPVSEPELRLHSESNTVAILLPFVGQSENWSVSVNGESTELDIHCAQNGYIALFQTPSNTEAAISFIVIPPSGYSDLHLLQWISPSFRQYSPSSVEAAAFEQRSIDSANLGEEREYYFFRTSQADETALAGLILTGDGLAASQFAAIAANLQQRGLIHPIAIASTHPSSNFLPDASIDQRSAEYVPSANLMEGGETTTRDEVYLRHDQFFNSEFLPAVRHEFFNDAELPPLYTAGNSNSGTFAIMQMLSNPGMYRAGFAGSPPFPSRISEAVSQSELPPSLTVFCGSLEGNLCQNLRSSLGDANVHERFANHTSALWEEGFAFFLLSHFGVENAE